VLASQDYRKFLLTAAAFHSYLKIDILVRDSFEEGGPWCREVRDSG